MWPELGAQAWEVIHWSVWRRFLQGLPGLIQQANRPVIRTVQGKVNNQVIEADSAFLPDAKESDPQLNSADHKKAVNMLSHPSRIRSSSSRVEGDIQSLP